MLGTYAAIRQKLAAAPGWQVPLWALAAAGVAILFLVWAYLHQKSKEQAARELIEQQKVRNKALEDVYNATSAAQQKLAEDKLVELSRDLRALQDRKELIEERDDIVKLTKQPDPDWSEIKKAWDELR